MALSFLERRRATRQAFGFIRCFCLHRESICTQRKEKNDSTFIVRKDRYSELSLKKRFLFTDSHTAIWSYIKSRGDDGVLITLERIRLTVIGSPQHWIRFRKEQIRFLSHFSASRVSSYENGLVVKDSVSRSDIISQGIRVVTCAETTICDGSKEKPSGLHATEFRTAEGDALPLSETGTIVADGISLSGPRNRVLDDSEAFLGSAGLDLCRARGQVACNDSCLMHADNDRDLSESGGIRDARSCEISTDSTLGEISHAPVAGEKDGHAASVPHPLNSFDPSLLFRGNPAPADMALISIFDHFCENQWAFEQALKCNISSVLFPIAVSKFQKFLVYRCASEPIKHLLKLGPSHAADEFLFQLFAEYYAREFQSGTAKYESLIQTADLTKPHTWFPFARGIKRKFIYHCGPTNSGKTYNALKKFMEASSGVYCAPLRLLAMEVFDKVNAEGVKCNLHTGQEKKDAPLANHLACTIEMATTQQRWEVAVIDEIQLLNEEYRGWAWTRAVLGLQANIIHLCGDPSVLDLVRRICATTGEQLEENFYERFKPLSVETQSLEGTFCNVQPGDCIVVFSRKDIFGIKKAVERATPNRCCVVYGALPPETRRQQAKLFNDPTSGYDVLVATDAVGMGLNLNIRRVVFYTFDKFNGSELKPVHSSQVKQIAGRAGRRGSLFPEGKTTTFYQHDLPYLVKSLEEPFSTVYTAGLFPTSQQMEPFAGQLPGVTFTQLLDWFADSCRVDGFYFLCRHDNIKKVAYIIDQVEGLSLEDRLKFCFSPVNIRDLESTTTLLKYARAYSQKLPVRLLMGVPKESAENDIQLLNLETKHQLVSLYLWLSQHFTEECFPDKIQAEQIAADITLLLGESLIRSGIQIDTEYTPTKQVSKQSHTSGMLFSVLEVLRDAADESAPQKFPYSI